MKNLPLHQRFRYRVVGDYPPFDQGEIVVRDRDVPDDDEMCMVEALVAFGTVRRGMVPRKALCPATRANRPGPVRRGRVGP